jgi:hypothetical protein
MFDLTYGKRIVMNRASSPNIFRIIEGKYSRRHIVSSSQGSGIFRYTSLLRYNKGVTKYLATLAATNYMTQTIHPAITLKHHYFKT